MKRPTVSAAVYLGLVFLSGIAIGSVGYGFYSAKAANPCGPDAVRHRYIDDMRSRLSLSSDQVDKLGAILEETRGRFHALRDKFEPEVKAIQDQQTSRIRAILNDQQRAEFEKLRQERERERERHRGK